jgi:hypothetical protein
VTARKSGFIDAADTSDPTAVVSSLAAKHLDMETSSSTRAGSRISVEIDDLFKGEAYTIKIDNIVVKTGNADSDGEVDTKVTVPLSLQPGAHTITAIGAFQDRNDTDSLTLKSPLALDVELRSSSVSKGGTQRVYVDDLLRGEKVEIRFDGTLISPSTAVGDSSGEYTLSFPVGTTTGTHSVKVTGTYDGRNVTKTFKVTSG